MTNSSEETTIIASEEPATTLAKPESRWRQRKLIWTSIIVSIGILIGSIAVAWQLGVPIPFLVLAPKPGHWAGDPSESHSVSFDVTSDGLIRNFQSTIKSGSAQCTITSLKDISIGTDGSFLIGERGTDGTLSDGYSGKFTDTTIATGEYSQTFNCGKLKFMFFGENHWEAKWQNP